jgi:WD40 repeat protein
VIEDLVKIFGIETGTYLHTKPVYSVCWNSSGNYLASISDNLVRVWNFGSGGDVEFETNVELFWK